MKYVKNVLANLYVLGLVGCKEKQLTEDKSLEVQDVPKCEAREKNDILKNSKDSSPNIDNITKLNTADKNNLKMNILIQWILPLLTIHSYMLIIVNSD